MSTLTNKKISDTYKGLLKTADETTLSATPKAITDGDGNNSGVLLDNAGNLKVNSTVEFGSLKDAAEDITIEKFVDEADGIANNDNDTSLPTSAAVKDYVDTKITAEDLDFSGNSGTGDVDLDSEVFAITGSNGISTTALDNTLDIDGSTLQTAINTNAANITTNATNISQNDADIATNASNISTNASNIASNDTDIATNAANIATNVTNISTNQSNISTNATNIATNTTDIASNAADIASNDTDISNLQTSVSTNTTDIASNAVDISTNSTAISTNASGISTNAAAISTNATDIATNSSNITTNAANIATNTTNIATNTTDIATNVTDIATNANNIASNDTDIATNASNISSNATNIATNAANITSNDTDIATNAANIATNTTNISTNATNIASNDADISALQTDVSTNTTNIATNATNIASNDTDIAANASNISTNTTNISANATNITSNDTDIATNAGNISTNTSNISTNTSNISTNTSNISANAGNIQTNADDIADLQTDVSSNTTAIAGKVARAGDSMSGKLNINYQDAEIEIRNNSFSGSRSKLAFGTTMSSDQASVQLNNSSSNLEFRRGVQSSAPKMTIQSSAVYLSSPLRIGDDAAANELDDYEEGTYNLKFYLGSGSTAYDGNNGFSTFTNNSKYVKVGRKVTLYIKLQYTGVSNAVQLSSSRISLGNFPFTPLGSEYIGGTYGFQYMERAGTTTIPAEYGWNGVIQPSFFGASFSGKAQFQRIEFIGAISSWAQQGIYGTMFPRSGPFGSANYLVGIINYYTND